MRGPAKATTDTAGTTLYQFHPPNPLRAQEILQTLLAQAAF